MESWFSPVQEGLTHKVLKAWNICVHFGCLFQIYLMGAQQRQSPSQTRREQKERPKPTEIFNVLQNEFQKGAEPHPENAVPRCVVMSHSLGLHKKQWDITRTIISLSRSQSNSGRRTDEPRSVRKCKIQKICRSETAKQLRSRTGSRQSRALQQMLLGNRSDSLEHKIHPVLFN